MKLERLTPILNVSNIQESFAWFEKLGWTKGWDWGDPPDFGGVCSGDCEIFLCQNGQGSRGGPEPRHVGDDDTGGVWMSWWVGSPGDVDVAYQLALQQGITVLHPPTMNHGILASVSSCTPMVTRFALARELGKSDVSFADL